MSLEYGMLLGSFLKNSLMEDREGEGKILKRLVCVCVCVCALDCTGSEQGCEYDEESLGFSKSGELLDHQMVY
jgi:hypothetical protein